MNTGSVGSVRQGVCSFEVQKYHFQRIAHGNLGSGEADEMPQGKLRSLEFPEGRCRLEHTHGEKQYQQAIAHSHQSVADSGDYRPNFTALKGLRRLGNQLPQLGQLPVPALQRLLQCAYDPIVNQFSPPVCIRVVTLC